MVLELRIPYGRTWSALRDSVPALLTYLLSFVYLGICWNNHHHLLLATERVSGLVLWANPHLLFWLSLIPFTAGSLGETELAATPAAACGIVLLAAGLAYLGLQAYLSLAGRGLDACARDRPRSQGKGVNAAVRAWDRAGFVNRWLLVAIYVTAALLWLIPDRRLERILAAAPRR